MIGVLQSLLRTVSIRGIIPRSRATGDLWRLGFGLSPGGDAAVLAKGGHNLSH